jgi:anti-anti-sigma regulatory factor
VRRRFTASSASDFCRHDHVAWCGDGPEGIDRLAVSAFASAAERGELMLFVSEDPDLTHLSALDNVQALTDGGALRVASVEDTYRHVSDPPAQRALFEQTLDEALVDGHTGICVVADNSQMAAGTDEEFATWLAWEATADRMQAHRPVTGVCYFNRHAVPEDRLADLAVVHPVLSGLDEPSLQLFVDDDVVRLVGAVDYWCADQLRRVLETSTNRADLALDLSELEFVDHQGLLALNQAAHQGNRLRVRGAKPIVRHLWSLLDVASPALEFC